MRSCMDAYPVPLCPRALVRRSNAASLGATDAVGGVRAPFARAWTRAHCVPEPSYSAVPPHPAPQTPGAELTAPTAGRPGRCSSTFMLEAAPAAPPRYRRRCNSRLKLKAFSSWWHACKAPPCTAPPSAPGAPYASAPRARARAWTRAERWRTIHRAPSGPEPPHAARAPRAQAATAAR
jgi:hypothetical protein